MSLVTVNHITATNLSRIETGGSDAHFVMLALLGIKGVHAT